MAELNQPKTGGGAGRSLLLVDDDKPLRERLKIAMERRGFRVLAAESVAEGIKIARSEPPEFAVIDLRLADGSGLDVVAALRAAWNVVRGRQIDRWEPRREPSREPVEGHTGIPVRAPE